MKRLALLLLLILFSQAACRKPEVKKTAERLTSIDAIVSPATSPPIPGFPDAVTAPQYRRAPEGVFFLLERVSVPTDSGVIGFAAGTRVRRVGSRSGDALRVTDGTTKFDVAAEKLTDDVDLGALVGRRDSASQRALAEYLQAQQNAEGQARENDKVWMDDQDGRVAERRRRTQEALAQRANPLDRGSYNQTYWYPYWYPYGYHYRSPVHVDRFGHHYWIDRWGGWHYVP